MLFKIRLFCAQVVLIVYWLPKYGLATTKIFHCYLGKNWVPRCLILKRLFDSTKPPEIFWIWNSPIRTRHLQVFYSKSNLNFCLNLNFIFFILLLDIKRLYYMCFPVNLAIFFRVVILQNTSEWLFPLPA